MRQIVYPIWGTDPKVARKVYMYFDLCSKEKRYRRPGHHFGNKNIRYSLDSLSKYTKNCLGKHAWALGNGRLKTISKSVLFFSDKSSELGDDFFRRVLLRFPGNRTLALAYGSGVFLQVCRCLCFLPVEIFRRRNLWPINILLN